MDYFVTDKRLDASVLGVALIHDTGARPHSALRLWLKGRPHNDMVRMLQAPRKADAVLPPSCLPERAHQQWDEMIATIRESGTEDSGDRSRAELDEAYLKWIGRVEEQIADTGNIHDRDRKEFCTRTKGARFVWKCALGNPGSGGRRVSQITLAWRVVASWLTDVAQSFGRKPPPQAQAVADRAKRRLKIHCWQHIGKSVHAVVFKQWLANAVEAGFEDRVAVHWLRSSASLVADRAATHDKRRADAAW